MQSNGEQAVDIIEAPILLQRGEAALASMQQAPRCPRAGLRRTFELFQLCRRHLSKILTQTMLKVLESASLPQRPQYSPHGVYAYVEASFSNEVG